jgi:hypothetical protein
MPPIQLPPSQGVSVSIRAINTGAKIICPTDTCCRPRIKGHEFLNLPTIAFLIEHGPSNTKVLFDGGVRKDFQNFSPAGMRQLNKCVPDMHVSHDVRDVLDRAGYTCDNLSTWTVSICSQGKPVSDIHHSITYMEVWFPGNVVRTSTRLTCGFGSHHHWDHVRSQKPLKNEKVH